MTEKNTASRRGTRLRFTGVAVLLLAMVTAALVYWHRSPELPDDASTAGFYKASSRRMGVMYGQFGVLVDDLCNDLKRPGTQAVIILAVGAILMFACLYFARLIEDRSDEDQQPGQPDS